MTNKGDGITVQVAQKLVGYLPEEMNDQLKKFILQAEENSDPAVDIEILDLLSSHENVRRWMKEQMIALNGTRGLNPLAGDSSAPVSNKWICPKDKMESLPVIQEGEPAPQCEKHKITMVRMK